MAKIQKNPKNSPKMAFFQKCVIKQMVLAIIYWIPLARGATVWIWTLLEVNWAQCTQIFASLTQPFRLASSFAEIDHKCILDVQIKMLDQLWFIKMGKIKIMGWHLVRFSWVQRLQPTQNFCVSVVSMADFLQKFWCLEHLEHLENPQKFFKFHFWPPWRWWRYLNIILPYRAGQYNNLDTSYSKIHPLLAVL